MPKKNKCTDKRPKESPPLLLPTKIKKKTGPKGPMIPIDWELVDRYLMAGCEGTEIAAVIGCYPTTLYTRCQAEKKQNFTAYCASKRSHGEANLRFKQYQMALSGDKTLLIWLGKQRLGQSEKMQQHIATDIPIQILMPHNGRDAVSDNQDSPAT